MPFAFTPRRHRQRKSKIWPSCNAWAIVCMKVNSGVSHTYTHTNYFPWRKENPGNIGRNFKASCSEKSDRASVGTAKSASPSAAKRRGTESGRHRSENRRNRKRKGCHLYRFFTVLSWSFVTFCFLGLAFSLRVAFRTRQGIQARHPDLLPRAMVFRLSEDISLFRGLVFCCVLWGRKACRVLAGSWLRKFYKHPLLTKLKLQIRSDFRTFLFSFCHRRYKLCDILELVGNANSSRTTNASDSILTEYRRELKPALKLF